MYSRTSLEEARRKAEKSRNARGDPIKLQSKILAIAVDPHGSGSVYVAESGGILRRVSLDVGEQKLLSVDMCIYLTTIGMNPWASRRARLLRFIKALMHH